MRIKLGKLLAVVLAACMTLSSVSLSALMDPDKLPSEGGELANYSYTLTEDIDLTGGYIVTHDVTIDLNGHTIKNVMDTESSNGAGTMFTVLQGGHLTIKDSSAKKTGTLDQNGVKDRTIRLQGDGYWDGNLNQWFNYNGKLTIDGGNFVKSADGVVYASGYDVVVTLNDGLLQNNTTEGNGGAICVDGGGTFIMNGGTVDHNESTGVADADGSWGHVGGGGIYVGGNMTMSGGTVSNNIAGAGGGIFANSANPWGQNYFNTFEMTGGTVTGNVANQIEGGGVRIGVSVDATFHAASGKTIEISGNQTTSDTDWGGGGIFITEGGKATMYDTLITGNTADGFGGGLTGCPTAHNYVMSTDGAAIFGNTAEGTQDVTDSTKLDSAFSDAVFTRPGKFYQDYFCNLKSIISDTMLGGGSERWEGTIDSEAVTFGPGETRISSSASGLTAYPTDADKELARSRAKIYVQNNHSATHGGGILNNGMLFFGESPDGYVPTYFSIPVKKSITGAKNLTINDRFKFELELVSVVSKNTANDEVINDNVSYEAYTDSVTVVGAAEGRFKSIQFTDPDNKLQVGASGYSDNYLTYTFEVREVEYQPAEGEPDNQYEYTLDNTVWRVEADVIAEAIGDPDIESMFNVNRYLTVREIRLYKNDETLPADTVTNATHNGGTITADKGFIASFNNTLGTGDLKVEKKTVIKKDDGVKNYETKDTFTFTVTLKPALNGIFGDMEFKDGKVTFDLGNGEQKTATGLPIGVHYTVTEADNEKYSSEITGASGAIAKDTTATVTATNTVKTGSLSITKKLKGNAPGADTKEFKFTVTGPDEFSKTVTINGEGEETLNDLVPGEYKITEQNADIEGYTLEVSGNTSATVTAEKVANATITNTYTQKPGSLKIVKSVVGGGDEAANKTFTFTVTGPNYSNTVTITGNGETKLDNLVPGEYTVTEQDANIDGYTLEVTGNGETKTVTADQVAEFDITNTYTQKLGSLKIVKSVEGGGEEAANKTFTFTVTGTNYSKTVTIKGNGETKLDNLVPGEYKITETGAEVEGYTLTVTGIDDPVTVAADQVTEVNVTNTYTQKPGSLKIVKSVEGGGDEAANKTFTFTVTGPNYSKTVTITGNGYAELENLVPGEYTVTENKTSAQINGYTLTVDGEGKATVSAEDVANVTIVNTYTQKPGSLKIVKSVVGGGDEAAGKTFTFTVTGPDGYNETVTVIGAGEAVLENLVPGTYTVTEDTASAEVEGYTLSVTGNGSTATIAADGNAEVTVTNNYTRKVGDLSVTKTLAGPVTDDDMAGSYNITVTLTNADGSPYSGNYTLSGADYEYSVPISLVFTGFTSDSKNKTIQISGLPVGTRYTVTETAVDETFNVSYTAVTGDGVVTADSVSGSITEALSMATVTNTKKETERFALNVTKTVEGAAPAEPFKFNVTFYIKTAEGITAPAGAVLGADGAGNITYAFEIPANTTVSFTGVPKGTYYEITEAPAEGYTLINQSLTSGTLLGNAEATFVNKENVRGSLSIVKELIGEGNALNAYNVNVTLTYPDERGVVSEVVTLTPGMPKIYEDLPVGTAFEVSETAESADGYNVSVSINGGGYVPGVSATGTVTETAPVVSVAVRNEKEAPKESSLTVIKTVRGDNIDPTRAFNFTVTLTDTTINGVYGEMEFVNGVASFALAGGQSKSADKLPEGIGYTVKELDENLDGYTTEYPANATGILSSDSSAIVEVINTTSTLPGSLSVTKQVTGNGAEMGRTFMFTVMLNDPTITGQYGDMYFNGGVATIYLAHGMRATATGLPAGVGYNVIENDYGDYIPQAINPTGVIPDNGSAEVVYINHRDEQLGSLSVSKTVEGEGYDPEQEFTFTVTINDPTVNGQYGDMFFSGGVATLTLKAGRTATATNLPADTGYTVTEAPVENYTSAATGDVGIIPAGNGAYAQFVNTYEAPKVGGFSLMKIVSGTAADPNRYFTFQVILSDATINGVYGDLAFADGFSTVFLRHGDIVYCDNLPEGTGYTVIELDADDYEVSCNAPAGTIVSGETGEIIFENHKDVPPPPPPEIPENEENPHGDDLNAGVGGDRDRHGDDMNAGVGMDDMNPATGDFMSESFMNGMAMLSAIVAAIAAFGAAVLIRKRKKD